MTTDTMSGQRGKMTSSGPKQHVVWAPLICFFFFCLFVILFTTVSHNIYVSTTSMNNKRHHATMEGKDDEQWAQTTQRMTGPLWYVFLLFFLPSWLFHGMESIGGCWLGCSILR